MNPRYLHINVLLFVIFSMFLFYLLGHRRAVWPFLYLIFKICYLSITPLSISLSQCSVSSF